MWQSADEAMAERASSRRPDKLSSRPSKLPSPKLRLPTSPEAVALKIRDDPNYEQTNLLFFIGADASGGKRNVTAENWEYCVLTGMMLPEPKFGRNYHVTKGHAHGENQGMIDDFHGCREAASLLLDNPAVLELTQRAFGEDFCLGEDRANYRLDHLNADTTAAGKKSLTKIAHQDRPDASGAGFAEWKDPARGAKLVTETAVWKQGQVCIVALSQSTTHSIGKGGLSDNGGHVLGWFLGPMSPKNHAAYKTATMAQYNKELKKIQRPREWKMAKPVLRSAVFKGEKCVYMWPELAQLSDPAAEDIFAAGIAYGLRPLLYPSQKVIDVPQSYSPPYEHYTGYRPDPARQLVVPAVELALLEAKVPEVARHFRKVAAELPGHLWACEVSKLSRGYLLRVFGVKQGATKDSARKRQKLALSAGPAYP